MVPAGGKGPGASGTGADRQCDRPDGRGKAGRDAAAISVDGQPVETERFTYVMLHKPAGVLSATEDSRQSTVLDLLPPELRKRGLSPVGRLDKDTEGLLLLINDGALAHRLLAQVPCGQGVLCPGGGHAGTR